MLKWHFGVAYPAALLYPPGCVFPEAEGSLAFLQILVYHFLFLIIIDLLQHKILEGSFFFHFILFVPCISNLTHNWIYSKFLINNSYFDYCGYDLKAMPLTLYCGLCIMHCASHFTHTFFLIALTLLAHKISNLPEVIEPISESCSFRFFPLICQMNDLLCCI